VVRDLGRGQGIGEDQPAEGTVPGRQQAFLQRRGIGLEAAAVAGEEAVGDPADPGPAGEGVHRGGHAARRHDLAPCAGRQGQRDFAAGRGG
jgi:hypothetical protein